MRLLFLSGIAPTPEDPDIGIFVTRRLAEVTRAGISFDAYVFRYRDTVALAAVKRILGLPVSRPDSEESLSVDGVVYRSELVAHSLVDVIAESGIAERCFQALRGAVEIPEYDLVHAHWAYPEGYVAHLIKEEFGIPYVLTLHGSDIHAPRRALSTRDRRVGAALQNADRTIFVSNGLMEIARAKGFRVDNARVIQNGIPLKTFKPMDQEVAARRLGVEPWTGPTVGFIGGLAPVKGADRLPAIFERVGRQRPDARFIVIGDGPLRGGIESAIAASGLRALFPGFVHHDAVPAWLNLMDVLVLPSRNEGFPCVLVEAQACGVPVVGSDRGGIPEAVGTGGVIVPSGSDFIDHCADAIIQSLASGRSAEQVRSCVATRDWSATVREEIGLYHEVLGQRRPEQPASILSASGRENAGGC